MKILLLFISAVLFTPFADAQPYLEQTPPGLQPVKFAPDIVSIPDEFEFGSITSRDGKEFYYAVDVEGRAEIRVMKLENHSWSKPRRLIVNDTYSYNDQFFSPDENRIFFISDMPLNGTGDKKDYDIWFVQREGKGWSKPIHAGEAINSDKNEYYVSFTQKGTMYFSSNTGTTETNKSNYDIYASAPKDGAFQTARKLPANINTAHYEADVFVAYDESYLIFCGDRPEGKGKGDLYISFRNANDSWTDPKSMGDEINTAGHELCPFVTKDGKYFFFTSNRDIYWVDAKILEKFR